MHCLPTCSLGACKMILPHLGFAHVSRPLNVFRHDLPLIATCALAMATYVADASRAVPFFDS